MKNRVLLFLGCIVLAVAFFYVMNNADNDHSASSEVSLIAVGDNLYHKKIYSRGYDAKTRTYDFKENYKYISELLDQYDLKVVNQETVFVDDYRLLATYPRFGTPKECGDALVNAGFNVILGANNHSWDKGIAGVKSTVKYWSEVPDVHFIGMQTDAVQFNTVPIIEKNGIKIALLNYTYGTNCPIPSKYYYCVNTLYDKNKIKNDLIYAEKNADITIVFPHWGVEYVHQETKAQQDMAEFFTSCGADVIIGTHPHVVQPVKTIKAANGNTSICYYSLGNFLSGQDKKPRILGGVAALKIRKTVTNGTAVTEVIDNNFMPSVTYSDPKKFRAYLLRDFSDDLAMRSLVRSDTNYLWDLWMRVNQKSEHNFEKKI